jgi:hypothetical protein
MNKVKQMISGDIESLKDLAEKSRIKLETDFIYNFQWGYAGTQYKAMLEANRLQHCLNFITEQPDRAEEWLTENVKSIEKEILGGGFLGTSTSIYSNLAHTYNKEVDCYLLKRYKYYLKNLK